MSFLWTEEAVEQLRALWTDGEPASHIAARLGCQTRNAVIGKINRLGLKRGPEAAAKARSQGGKKGGTERRQQLAVSWPRPVVGAKPEGLMPAARERVQEIPCKPLNLTVLELTCFTCKFAVTDEAPHTFCGTLVAPGSRYCLHHHRIAYRPFPERRAA